MADTTEMNSQVTDAVSQDGLLVAGSAPAHAAGHGYEVMAHSTGLSFQNTINAQQQGVVQGNVEAVLLTQHLLGLVSAQVGAAASIAGQDASPLLRRQPRRQARRHGRRHSGRP